MPTESAITTTIPMLGGYKVCNGINVGSIGYMGNGSVNFMQTPDGITTRAPSWLCTLFHHDPDSFYDFLHVINAAIPPGSNISIIYPASVRFLQIVEFYPYRPEQTTEIAYLDQLGCQRYMVVFKIAYWRSDIPEVEDTVLVFFDIRLDNEDPFSQTIIAPVLYLQPAADRWTTMSPVYPEVDAGYFKTFFIFTFPNSYQTYPILLWWDAAAYNWTFQYWLSGPNQDQHTALPTGEIPTVCTVMTVKNGVSSFLVWGCSENGTLRTTKVLDEDLLGSQVAVQRLLSTNEEDNFTLTLSGGASEIPNRGMIQFNSVLFVFGFSCCYIIPQLVVLGEEGVLELAPQYNLAPFRGGCLNQSSLALGWNEVYVGTVDGAVYTINRVMESGSYTAVDLFLSTGVLGKDINFKFKDTYWLQAPQGLGTTTFYPLRRLHLFYDHTNNAMMCHFYWVEQSEEGPDIREVQRLALYAYRPDCVKGSTGWSCLEAGLGGVYIWHPSVFLLSCVAVFNAPYPPTLSCYMTPMPPYVENRRDFYIEGRYRYNHLLVTPFWVPSLDQTMFLYQSMHFEIDKLGHEDLCLSLRVGTDLDQPLGIDRYMVPAIFTLDRIRLDVDAFSGLGTQNSVILGCEGTHIAVTLGEPEVPAVEPPYGPPEIGNNNAFFSLNSITLKYKPTGSAPNVSILHPITE